jgi:hypothetical protein
MMAADSGSRKSPSVRNGTWQWLNIAAAAAAAAAGGGGDERVDRSLRV